MTSLDLLRRTRWIAFASLLAFSTTSVSGCAAEVGEEPTTEGGEELGGPEYLEASDTAVDDVTDVSHTVVKRQSIGNCWIYATTGWVESMRRRYNGQEMNISESYLTYWDWYQKITDGEVGTNNTLETGGHWGTAADLLRSRGVVSEADFLPEEATAEMSEAQRRALAAINTSLATGALSTAAARDNGTIVRDELDRAFGLGTTVVAEMDRVFGADGVRTLAQTRAARTIIKRVTEVSLGTARSATGTRRSVTLSDLTGTARSSWNPDQRSGSYAWQGVSYPSDATGRANFIRRMQRAMNDGHPVIVSWLVDFNGLNSSGEFKLDELTRRGVGSQGGHLTVVEDYTVDNVPGYGTLGLGQLSAEQRTAALQGTMRMLRIKNSWGANRADRASNAGYYDLHMTYLNGPITWTNGGAPGAGTSRRTPFSSMILPAGY